MSWAPCIPFILSSSGDSNDAYRGIQRDIALKAPMKDFIAVQVFGLPTLASADVLWLVGEITPPHQFQPRIMHFFGQMKVFCGFKVRLLSFNL